MCCKTCFFSIPPIYRALTPLFLFFSSPYF
nr:MAG TPA: hypothetical protein [Caudoviricetes sp.]